MRDDKRGFAMQPQALETLANFQREEEKHRDHLSTQVATVALTFVFILVTLLTA